MASCRGDAGRARGTYALSGLVRYVCTSGRDNEGHTSKGETCLGRRSVRRRRPRLERGGWGSAQSSTGGVSGAGERSGILTRGELPNTGNADGAGVGECAPLSPRCVPRGCRMKRRGKVGVAGVGGRASSVGCRVSGVGNLAHSVVLHQKTNRFRNARLCLRVVWPPFSP
ncbi:hypothetical protein BC628DRAFT_551411 [Trametes gibbosa]|nr:hypothetical protein BC628DRAFT_551411 [Trametes gibbosa]